MSPSDRPVVTRFAPSPTGALHIGNARAALFNWLYARHRGGMFLLRIEDTDRRRSTPEAVQVIYDSLQWLGLAWDGEPILQSARAERHRAAVDRLLEAGWAYRCHLSPEEAEAARETSRTNGYALRSPWRDKAGNPDAPHVVRFKTPMDGATVIDDAIRGEVSFANKDLEDFVLLRTDGTTIYNLAVTVDDHDMGITHVIRGEEHLSNAGRQSLLYRGLGWETPIFAHLPMILGDDGAKLSKRHGAQSVGEFRAMGYLPEALRNYLAKLGWGHGDDELFSDEEAIAWFDVVDVVKAAAKLDRTKLNFVNNHYIRTADDERLAGLVVQSLGAETLAQSARERLPRAIAAVKEGAKTIVDLAALCRFALAERPLAVDAKIAQLLDEETRDRLGRLCDCLANAEPWEAAELADRLRAFAQSEGVGLGRFGPALRGVLSGGWGAPDLAGALATLGRQESLDRIADALSR
ncbi:MAG: glutamate--tRNA ligase [Caulobacteraceae bacterium]